MIARRGLGILHSMKYVQAESWKAGPACIVRCCKVLVKSITGSDALGAEGWENTVAFRFRIRTRMSEVNPKAFLGRVESAGTLKDPYSSIDRSMGTMMGVPSYSASRSHILSVSCDNEEGYYRNPFG